MMESATALVREKRFEEALSLLKSGLRRYPDEMELRWALDSTRLDAAACEREQMAEHSQTAEHLAVEHSNQASSQTRVTPAVAWSAQAKAMSIAGAVIAVLAGGWLFHSFSSRQPRNLPVSPAPVSPAPVSAAKIRSAGSVDPATTSPIHSQAQPTSKRVGN